MPSQSRRKSFLCPQQRNSVYSSTKILYKNKCRPVSEGESNFMIFKLGRRMFEKKNTVLRTGNSSSWVPDRNLTHTSVVPKVYFIDPLVPNLININPLIISNKTMDRDLAINVHYVFSVGKQIKCLSSSFPWCF